VAVVVGAVTAILAVSLVSCSSESETASTQDETTTTQDETTTTQDETTTIRDEALVQEEADCAEGVENAPWYQTVNPFEHADIERTVLFPCARFAGSMDGSNVVDAGEPVGQFTAPFNLATRGPDEIYMYGGGSGDAKPPSLQTYIAKLDANTLEEVWRTNLSDASENNQLHLSGAVDVLEDGSLVAISDHTLYKLDGDTGEIVAKNDMPTGDSEPTDSAFNGIDAFPDGTIIARSMNRPAGCTLNGYTAAATTCPGAPTSAPGSVLVAVDSEDLGVLAWEQLPENIIGRVTTTEFEGRNFAYVSGAEQLYRYEWDGTELAQDPDWGPVTYVKPGQAIAGAAVVMNDWVTLSTNGNPATVPMSVVAISQADDSRIESIDPTPSLEEGQYSYYYAHVTADPDTNRIYVMDAGQGTASAIELSDDGKLSLLWQEKQRSNSYMTLIGPQDKRVFVAPNFVTDVEEDAGDPTKLNPGPEGANYTEQIQWRDAATGELLAESEFYGPAATGAQVPPGYGGMIYNLLNDGRIVPLYARAEE
jgi:outer membrane protein assembly factor BamB